MEASGRPNEVALREFIVRTVTDGAGSTSVTDRAEAALTLLACEADVLEVACALFRGPDDVKELVSLAARRRPHLERREDWVSYELHVMVVRKLEGDEDVVRRMALSRLHDMRRKPRNGVARSWLARWEILLNESLDQLQAGILADSEMAAEMRQLSPFAGALTDEERFVAIRKARTLAAL